MIRHTILFKVKSNVSKNELDQSMSAMRDLANKLSGIFSIIVDECHFHDEKSANFFIHNLRRGVSHAISIDFTDQNALDNFFKNPITHPAKNMIVNIAENGYEGIVGFDLENREI